MTDQLILEITSLRESYIRRETKASRDLREYCTDPVERAITVVEKKLFNRFSSEIEEILNKAKHRKDDL